MSKGELLTSENALLLKSKEFNKLAKSEDIIIECWNKESQWNDELNEFMFENLQISCDKIS